MRFAIILLFVLLLPSAFANYACIDQKAELFTANNLIMVLKVGTDISALEIGDRAILDLKNYDESSCFNFEKEAHIGSSIVLDFSVDEGFAEQLLISDKLVSNILLKVSEREGDLTGEIFEEVIVDKFLNKDQILQDASMNSRSCSNFLFTGTNVVMEGTVHVDLPICSITSKGKSLLKLCGTPVCTNGPLLEENSYENIGLKYYFNGQIHSIAVENPLFSNSPLKIYKNGFIYSIVLVDIHSVDASPIKIKLPDGTTKAMMRFD